MLSNSFLRGRFGLVGFVASSLILLTVVVTDIQAKRGCFAYGHSCLGGLGKRAGQQPEDTVIPGMEERAVGDRFEQAQDGELVWPWLDGNAEQFAVSPGKQQLQKLTPQQLYQLSPFIRQLLRSMRPNPDLNIQDV